MSQSHKKREEIIPTNHRCRKWINVSIVWLIAPVLIFHAKAALDDQDEWLANWGKLFYIWLFIALALFWAVIVTYEKILFRRFGPFLIYGIVRAGIEIATAFTGTNPNQAQINGSLFLLALLASVYVTILDLIQWWRKFWDKQP